MGSGVIFYEYEKRENLEDHDMKADAELGTFKIRRYHFDGESFVHPLDSVWFDPDRLYEIPIEALMADKIVRASKSEESSAERQRSSRRPSPHYSPRTMPVAQRERSTSSVKGTRSFRRGTASSSVRKPRSWELIPPYEGWMCDADDKKEIGGMDPSEKEESSEEDPEMEEEYPATPSLPMDIDAEEDFQHYVEELGRAPEPSPLCNSQASVPDEPVEAADRQSASQDGPSYDLSGVWQPQSSSPSSYGIRAVRPYKAWGWTDYATLHTLSVRVSSPRALGYLCDMSSTKSGHGRGNRRRVAASLASDGEQPDLSNDFAEIAAALRESAAAMRETNAARERERESHANGDGSTAGNRVVTLTEFMRLRPSQFS
ncbi:hypothetical protein PIB30_045118 [Stylosanthes scabra]|uniref:Uncharacterized protein n=1 Tax=Stylosanthes scabra TaxID=79078 RepID=A0ABU6QGN3_9FABA|nr:hypothetical protein [Stylosanthes scabra]